MNNKELSKLAKEIILKGAKQKNIELPEFEVDLKFAKIHLEGAVILNNPIRCLLLTFNWGKHDKKYNYWYDIYRRLPSAITIKYKYLNV